MSTRLRNGVEYTLEAVGSVLVMAVGRLARTAYVPPATRPQPARRYIARRAIDGMVTMGRIIDRLSSDPAPANGMAGLRRIELSSCDSPCR
jgi:hypothetical protein